MPSKSRRRGSLLTTELLLILPIVVITILSMVEIGRLLLVRQRLDAACREGARVAAIRGDVVSVQQAVFRTLGSSIDDIQITVLADDAPVDNLSLRPGMMMRVIVSIPAKAVNSSPMNPMGSSDERLYAQSAMRRE